MTAMDCPSCHLPWRGHDNAACERARITRAVVEWRAALARCRGVMVRRGTSGAGHEWARAVDAAVRFETATAGIPEAERLARAVYHEHAAQSWGLDTPRGRADYAAGYRGGRHMIHANVREALRDLLDAHFPA